MSADPLAAFVTNAERHQATVHRVDPDDVTDMVAELVDAPAVGVVLPWDVDLPASVATDPTPADLDDAATGVTAAALGVADYGSLVLESDAAGSEAVSLFPERHVAVLRATDVVPGMSDAIGALGDRLRDGASAVLATGPSATADMGELVIGAHGPREVDIVLVDDTEDTDADADADTDGATGADVDADGTTGADVDADGATGVDTDAIADAEDGPLDDEEERR